MESAVEQLTAHHDALRFKYHQREIEWQQEYGSGKGGLIQRICNQPRRISLGALITEHAE